MKQKGFTLIELIIVIAIIAILALVVIGGAGCSQVMANDFVTGKVTSVDTKRTGEIEKYLVAVDVNGTREVFEVTDNIFKGNLKSSDIYFELKENVGSCYNFDVTGWRIGFLSSYRIINKATKVECGQ